MDTYNDRPQTPAAEPVAEQPQNPVTEPRPAPENVFRPAHQPEQPRPVYHTEQYRIQPEPFYPAPQPEPIRPAPQPEPIRPAPQPEMAPPQPPVAEQPAPRHRVSPYASSPYVNMPRQEESFHYVPQSGPPVKKDEPKEKKSSFWRRALAAVLVLVLVAAGCGLTAFLVDRHWQARAQLTADQTALQLQQLQEQIDALERKPSASAPVGEVQFGEGMTPAQVYAQCVDSVVAVNVTVNDYYYGEAATAGSGFILTEDGYIVTNYHVVEDATGVSVSMTDGTTLDAKVVGYDATNDVAVLKVDQTGLPAAWIGSSSAVNVGDMVVAIGNPLGELNATQTVGFICGKDREITTGGTIINMLQTDAAINPGNSGGPLFNMAGEVIGITTAKYSGTTSSGASIEGIGFAIPIDDVMGIIGDLQEYGYVTGAYLGVTVQNVDSTVSELYGLTGAQIVGIEPGYAADRAGLKVKDLIIGLDGIQIDSITDLTRALRGYKAGDTVTLTVMRNGLQLELEVTLDEKPQSLAQPDSEDGGQMPEGDYEEWYDFFFGE